MHVPSHSISSDDGLSSQHNINSASSSPFDHELISSYSPSHQRIMGNSHEDVSFDDSKHSLLSEDVEGGQQLYQSSSISESKGRVGHAPSIFRSGSQKHKTQDYRVSLFEEPSRGGPREVMGGEREDTFLTSYIPQFLQTDVKFIDHHPYKFRQIRELFNVSTSDYVHSFSETFKEKITEGGASGAFFFYSGDSRFISKSCTESEFQKLISIIGPYHKHVMAHPSTLLIRIYGAHCLGFMFLFSIYIDLIYIG